MFQNGPKQSVGAGDTEIAADGGEVAADRAAVNLGFDFLLAGHGLEGEALFPGGAAGGPRRRFGCGQRLGRVRACGRVRLRYGGRFFPRVGTTWPQRL